MKKILILMLVLTFVFSVCSFGKTKWVNSLKPKGKTVVVSLVKGNAPKYKIVVPEETELNEDLASTDLAEFLGKIYGVNFKIVTDENPINGNYISLGETKLLKADTTIKVPEVNEDGYAISYNSKTGNIYITGGFTCGALNGVYALLEEDLGCRFYTKLHDDVIPTLKSGKLSFVPRHYSPQFITRFPHNPEYDDNRSYQTLISKDRPYIRRNRLHSWEPNGGCHTVNMFCPKSNFEEHPEWFCMVDGERNPRQMCWSNKEMLDVMVENAIKEMGNYKKDTLCISPNDSFPCCDCPECNAFDKAHGNAKSASLINGMNYIAEKVCEKFPYAHIQTLAYLDTVTPPENLPLHPKLEIILCSDCCDWDYPLCTYDETNEFQDHAKKWINYSNRVITWNYIANYDHLLIPNPNNKVVAKNIKIMRDWGIKGTYLQGISAKSLSNDGYFKTWVWGKLLWNPDLDYDALKKDFCYGYYGDEIGELMVKYENSLDEMYDKAHAMPHDPNEKSEIMIESGLPVFNTPARDNIGVVFDHGIRWTPDVKMYTDEWINDSFELFEKAMELAKTDEEREKVKYAKLPVEYLFLCRNLGYLRLGGSYISKPALSEEQKAVVKPVYDEFTAYLNENGVACIGEITDMHNSWKNLNRKWKQNINLNMEGIGNDRLDKNNWLFTFDPDNVGVAEGFYNPNYDTSSWKKIQTEDTWDNQGFGKYIGNAWYKTTLKVNADQLKARKLYLLISAVDENSTVFVNGNLAIEHTMDKLGIDANAIYVKPVLVEIKDFLVEGDNDITIEVGNVAGAGGLYAPIQFLWLYKDVDEEDLLALS